VFFSEHTVEYISELSPTAVHYLHLGTAPTGYTKSIYYI